MLINNFISLVTPTGITTAWCEQVFPLEVAKAVLQTDSFRVINCYVDSNKGKFKHHSIVFDANRNKPGYEESTAFLNTVLTDLVTPITDLAFYGNVLVGPTWCFEDIPNTER